ncbi:hypothetical protein ACIHDR_03755 [Nocardia sp. NPDC052278]|uniref:hypothetical protein n=1 Tax=unclassified Nocardia TaxID=2637762 RepID=UPI003694AED6
MDEVVERMLCQDLIDGVVWSAHDFGEPTGNCWSPTERRSVNNLVETENICCATDPIAICYQHAKGTRFVAEVGL